METVHLLLSILIATNILGSLYIILGRKEPTTSMTLLSISRLRKTTLTPLKTYKSS